MNVSNHHFEAESEVAPLGKLGPVLLVTPQLVEMWWPIVEPLIDRCVRKSMKGEMTTADVKELALRGEATTMLFTNDRTCSHPHLEVPIVLVFTPVLYPQLSAVNILAMGGHRLHEMKDLFWTAVRGWAYMNGAQCIEAMVSPAMQRMIEKWGFKQTYVQMRYDLLEQDNV